MLDSACPRTRVRAHLGGDTDTIAAIAGAILGSVTGTAAFDRGIVDTITRVSGLRLEPVLGGLLTLREANRVQDRPPAGTDTRPTNS